MMMMIMKSWCGASLRWSADDCRSRAGSALCLVTSESAIRNSVDVVEPHPHSFQQPVTHTHTLYSSIGLFCVVPQQRTFYSRIFTLPPAGQRVCMSVCLFVCLQVAALVGRQITLFGRDRQVATPEMKSAVSDCSLLAREIRPRFATVPPWIDCLAMLF